MSIIHRSIVAAMLVLASLLIAQDPPRLQGVVEEVARQVAMRERVAGILGTSYGEVVFYRRESHGSLNILPATIRREEWPRVVLVGGEVASVYLREGEYRFQIFSPEPWMRESSATACQSAVLRVEVKRGQKVLVEVTPEVGNKSTAKFHWTLKAQNG
jgi:hypothetical protein